MSDTIKRERVKPSPAAKRLMAIIGDEWCGNDCPPGGGHRSFYVVEPHDDTTRVISSIDDGGFIGIGYPDKWHVIMRTHTARLFALWVLAEWVRGLFGLREAIYYRALHRHVSGSWRRIGKPTRAFARRRRSDAAPTETTEAKAASR